MTSHHLCRVAAIAALGCLLGGCKSFVPLWYCDDNTFVSLPYCEGETFDSRWWTVPPLLSWGGGFSSEEFGYERDGGTLLLGLGGWNRHSTTSSECGDWWAFPFVMREWREEFAGDSSRLTCVAAGLAGWGTSDDSLSQLLVFPLFYWNDGGSWLTPLGGRLNCGDTTNTVITPIAGVIDGAQTGGWLYPLWSHRESADFDARLALVDSPTLPDCIEVRVETNLNARSSTFGATRLRADDFAAVSETMVLLHDIDHVVWGHDDGDWYGEGTNACRRFEIFRGEARGNRLLASCVWNRTATYDLATRALLSRTEKVEGGLLAWLGLYWYDRVTDLMTGGESTRHRVFWKLWDWQESRDGGSADGYFQASILWRLFRYESDSEKGTSVDFLFIPIWR